MAVPLQLQRLRARLWRHRQASESSSRNPAQEELARRRAQPVRREDHRRRVRRLGLRDGEELPEKQRGDTRGATAFHHSPETPITNQIIVVVCVCSWYDHANVWTCLSLFRSRRGTKRRLGTSRLFSTARLPAPASLGTWRFGAGPRRRLIEGGGGRALLGRPYPHCRIDRIVSHALRTRCQ